ncbi:hypothetical protein CC99x_001550 [Candidatus Berkiella cookevillensis]|uniref:Uncharacterized protein n=1 Tax=Candidatus Berkiella cookevillensis TaxID=437022 RepID=A0A0Q9YSR6_9GAMM|nr:hypothetical protein [Candidatus Berkiella cookevillensis]MCS5707582.1 hypothetical protein [Candidatus Berkiella cookevillensis]
MAAFGPRLGGFAGRAAQNLSRIANGKAGHFAKEVGTELAADYLTNTAMDMLNFSPSDNVNKMSVLRSATSSKAGLASQLIQAALQGYEMVNSTEVKAQQSVTTSPPSSVSQRLQDLSQSVIGMSNPNFSFLDQSKFTEQFLSVIESQKFNFVLSQDKDPSFNVEKKSRQSPLIFNSALNDNNFLASYFSATKDADLFVKAGKSTAAEPDVEKKSTPKLK